MGLRPLGIFLLLQCGIDFRRQILTSESDVRIWQSKVNPGDVMVNADQCLQGSLPLDRIHDCVLRPRVVYRYYSRMPLCFPLSLILSRVIHVRVGVLVQWPVKLPAWEIGDRGFVPRSGIHASKKHNVSSPLSIVESLRDRALACSASDRQGSNFEPCVWAQFYLNNSARHHHEVLLAQFSLYVHKCGLKPH